jgi:hypothetical protein
MDTSHLFFHTLVAMCIRSDFNFASLSLSSPSTDSRGCGVRVHSFVSDIRLCCLLLKQLSTNSTALFHA